MTKINLNHDGILGWRDTTKPVNSSQPRFGTKNSVTKKTYPTLKRAIPPESIQVFNGLVRSHTDCYSVIMGDKEIGRKETVLHASVEPVGPLERQAENLKATLVFLHPDKWEVRMSKTFLPQLPFIWQMSEFFNEHRKAVLRTLADKGFF